MRFLAPLALCALFVLSGCASGNKLVGTWVPKEAVPNAKVEVEFKADGTGSSIGEIDAMGSKISMKSDFTYKLEGDNLTVTTGKTTVTGLPAGMSQPPSNEGEKNTGKVTFTGNDEVSMLPPMGGPASANSTPVAMVRKK